MALTKAGMIAAIVAQLDSDGHDSTAIASALQWGSICDALATYIEANISSSGGWSLVDSSVATGDASFVQFTGLNGDTALFYKLIYDILTPASTTVIYELRPNGLTTNQEAQRLYGTISSAVADEPASRIVLDRSTDAQRLVGETMVAASTGAARSAVGLAARGDTTPDSKVSIWGGAWSDTSTNLTSFNIVPSTGSAHILEGSRFYLYQLVTS